MAKFFFTYTAIVEALTGLGLVSAEEEEDRRQKENMRQYIQSKCRQTRTH